MDLHLYLVVAEFPQPRYTDIVLAENEPSLVVESYVDRGIESAQALCRILKEQLGSLIARSLCSEPRHVSGKPYVELRCSYDVARSIDAMPEVRTLHPRTESLIASNNQRQR